jgi:5-carboxymethyl-2-hydroxymuconate isomerase
MLCVAILNYVQVSRCFLQKAQFNIGQVDRRASQLRLTAWAMELADVKTFVMQASLHVVHGEGLVCAGWKGLAA